MTAADQAVEIYNKMKGFRVKNTHRKKCALAAVDLIIQEANDCHENYRTLYWLDVKTEIKKL